MTDKEKVNQIMDELERRFGYDSAFETFDSCVNKACLSSRRIGKKRIWSAILKELEKEME